MNKSPTILRGSAARKGISVPICDHSAACNPHQDIRHRQSTIKRVQRVAISKLFTREGGAGADGAILPYVGHLQAFQL